MRTAVALLLALPAVAGADPPRLLVVPPDDPAAARALASALSAHATVVGPELLPAERPDPAPARRAAAAIQQAEQLYGAARQDEALALLGAELARDAQALAEAADVAALARLRLWEGICLAKSGREADARAAFTAARALGSPPPDALRFPPDVLALYPAEPGAPVATEVATVPAGAVVEVDGAPGRQRTPVRLDLAPGEHVVRLRKAGFAAVARLLAAGDRIEVPLERVTGRALARALSGMRDAGVLDLEALETRALLVGALHLDGRVDAQIDRGRLTVARYDSRGRRRARAAGAPSDAEALVAALFGREERDGGPSIFGRWWFWTAAGVVIAGATVALLIATAPDDTIRYVPGGN